MASLLLIFITVLMYVQDGTGAEKYAWLFYLGVTIIVSSVALLSYRKSFYLAQRNHANAIEFFVSRHSREAVESFINEIIARRRAYLLEKYGRFNRLLSYEQQYHNLMWLADLDVLDNAEYLERLDELNHLFNITRELRGFQINLN